MNITIDKNYTTIAALAGCKEDAKQFKACYTDNDLLNALNAAELPGVPYIDGDVIKADASAMKCLADQPTDYVVTLYVFSWSTFYKVRYYTDGGLNINRDERLVDVRRYYFSREEKAEAATA